VKHPAAYSLHDLLEQAGGLFGGLLRNLQDDLVMEGADYSGRLPS
jgi:hypothetical protein